MSETIQHPQRFPKTLAGEIDRWAGDEMSRTAAVNHMCKAFLEALEIERLKRENEVLRTKIVKVAMAKKHPCFGCDHYNFDDGLCYSKNGCLKDHPDSGGDN